MHVLYSVAVTLIWYLTFPAKWRMTKAGSITGVATKYWFCWCCCLNLASKVLSVAWGKLQRKCVINTLLATLSNEPERDESLTCSPRPVNRGVQWASCWWGEYIPHYRCSRCCARWCPRTDTPPAGGANTLHTQFAIGK